MKIIVCIDERGGMTFNRRRQSRDARVSEDVLRTACGRLVVYPYSVRLLEEAVSALAPATDVVGGAAAFRVSELPMNQSFVIILICHCSIQRIQY